LLTNTKGSALLFYNLLHGNPTSKNKSKTASVIEKAEIKVLGKMANTVEKKFTVADLRKLLVGDGK